MSQRRTPRVFSIPPGAPFLPTLVEALQAGTLVPGLDRASDPLALSRTTIYLPTRRAARTLRGLLAEANDGQPAILPSIKALGEFDEEEAAFNSDGDGAFSLTPPIGSIDRLLLLAPLVQAWKRRLPAHIAKLFDEEIVVPVSTADTLWLARDLARLMDDVEIEGSDWSKLKALASEDFANWWQVTLDFLEIVTTHWPSMLAERGLSDPAAHRNALIRLEAARLELSPLGGPVIAAGSTGSIPATAELLSVISRLPSGAVVLPGLDFRLDERSWLELDKAKAEPALVGHPQYGLHRLLKRLGLPRSEVVEIGAPSDPLTARSRLISDALRPSETTDEWISRRAEISEPTATEALADVTLIEAANEREESLAIAIALRRAVQHPGATAALVTGDRNLARRVGAELLRFGIVADDSGGTSLSSASVAVLLKLIVRAVFEPGDPVVLLSLIKHPLVRLSLPRPVTRRAAETIELIALRGGTGRPDSLSLRQLFEQRLISLADDNREAEWFGRMSGQRIDDAREMLERLAAALAPLEALRQQNEIPLSTSLQCSIAAFEALGRDQHGSLGDLYARDAGDKLAEFLRGLLGATASFAFAPAEWPDVLDALLATETVKPRQAEDSRVAIWGTLEARLQSVDTLVLGGLNEGSWPRKVESDRFMSRLMRAGIDLEPPEREIGLAAHDFEMALGAKSVVLARSARAGDAPAVTSRWLQRLLTFAGKAQGATLKARGDELIGWARQLDEGPKLDFAPRPKPTPPTDVRPKRFSVTEIETLRRDPYAVYARRILRLKPINPLIRDPGAAERGSLFHTILHRFSLSGIQPTDKTALSSLIEIGRTCFNEAGLPEDVSAVWWPRFVKLSANIIDWERQRAEFVRSRHPEERAHPTDVGATGAVLSGFADRIDVLPAGMADILDYKTGSSPSKGQAHTLLAPQLALEGALLKRGAFRQLGALQPANLAFVRLKANGEVFEESILEHNRQPKSAEALSEEAWRRLEELLVHYNDPATGYLSRALPFREGDTDGDYDHLARVLEWSAGGDTPEAGSE